MGTSASVGGYFQDVKVTGECKFTGDVDCLKFSQTGEITVDGNLRLQNMKITGECEVKGRIDGASLRGQGQLTAGGGLRIEDIKLTGGIMVTGDCEAEQLQLTGIIEVSGLLNAGNLELALFGPCRAEAVGGGSISIKRSLTGALLNTGQGKKMSFTAKLIEGDQIELQSTKAQMVRGRRVIIGTGCEIDTVEYRDLLEIHKSAVVRNPVKVQ
jgi:cytoskeletal protein CcmA (bactofilin family)